MKARKLTILAFALLVGAFATRLRAAPVSSGDAIGLAAEWIGSPEASAPSATRRAAASGGGRQRARMRPSGAPSGAVRTCSIGGTNLFHLVALEGGGFVAVPADDSMTPILGFSTSGELPDENPANPFWALVGADAEAAITGRRRGERASRAYAFEDVAATPATRTAARTTRAAATNPIKTDSGIDDLRVAPFVTSRWNQKTHNNTVTGKAVYNYYTPPYDAGASSNYYCGCVATAMAQLMRFHQFPTNSITPQTFTCSVDMEDNYVDFTMKGGTYGWGNMPLVPTSSITDVQREEIGRLCYDAGVSMRMWYSSGGSAAFPAFSHDPLCNVFGYANARSYFVDYNRSISNEQIQNSILANIDAGYPVLLSVWGSSAGGHAILADGYGYSGGTLYCHLNMGWGGSEDYWYAIPGVPTQSYKFTALNAVIYNVFPDRAGELVTGRVLGPSGEPVEGAAVVATISYRKMGRPYTSTASVETSSTGHFAIFAPSGISSTISLSATFAGWVSTNAVTAATSSSVSPTNLNWNTGDCSSRGMNIGNSWGNDLYLAPTNKPFTLVYGW